MQPAHQPRELAEAALRPGPAGRQDLRLEHDLGIGDIGQVDGLARRELDRRAAQPAGDRHLVDPERSAIAGAGDLDRMGADADRDRQRTAALVGALGEQPHVVGRDDVDAGEALFLHDEAVDAAVDAELGVARDHHAGGDHRPAVEDRGHRDRQLVEVDLVADDDHLAGRGGLDVFRRDRVVDRLRELVLDLAVASRSPAPSSRARACGSGRRPPASRSRSRCGNRARCPPDRPAWRCGGCPPADAGRRARRSAAGDRGTGGNSPASSAPTGRLLAAAGLSYLDRRPTTIQAQAPTGKGRDRERQEHHESACSAQARRPRGARRRERPPAARGRSRATW